MAKNKRRHKSNIINKQKVRSRKYNYQESSPSTKVIGQIGGVMFILILVIVLYVAIHGRRNEMMYVALTFAFFSISLFSYGYWSAVNRGDGIWQYIGQNNLQHQQMSNPNYHFNNFPVEKHKLGKHSYMVAPPKMGGVRLEIYTTGTNASNDYSSQPQFHSASHYHRHHHTHHNHSNPHKPHHHHHHHHHHHDHIKTSVLEQKVPSQNISIVEAEQDDLNDDNKSVAIKFEVQLPQPDSLSKQHFNEDFTEVILPSKRDYLAEGAGYNNR